LLKGRGAGADGHVQRMLGILGRSASHQGDPPETSSLKRLLQSGIIELPLDVADVQV